MAHEGSILTAADLAGNGVHGDDPDVRGKFGIFGGRYVPEALIPALDEVASVYATAKNDVEFLREFDHLLRTYAGRPTTLTEVPRFAEQAGGARIVLKREDLTHTGAHKINNVLGQALLTKRLGKKRVIAETGAGQHGVATATAAALLGLECVIYMGAVDCERQALNVARMKLLGAKVVPVTNGCADAEGRHQRGVPRLGDQRRLTPTTCSARSPGRTRSRRSSATSPASSASRPAARCWS